MEFDGSLLLECSGGRNSVRMAEHKYPMTLHCRRCNTVLGDSLSLCGEIQSLDSILCLKVTDDVVVADTMETAHKGEMANCIYSPLKCRGCRSAVGTVIHSAPPRLAMVRSLFLLNKANIRCYILNSSSMVEASTLQFNLKALAESIKDVRQQFDMCLDQMAHIKNRLANRSGSSKLKK